MKQANEYNYDSNGNLTKDLNKGITGITYNCLNLPNAVTFSDGSTITYIYSADGTKLRTVHKIGSVTTTTDYCGNVIYENNTAKLLLTGEGYISLSDKKYHYYLQGQRYIRWVKARLRISMQQAIIQLQTGQHSRHM